MTSRGTFGSEGDGIKSITNAVVTDGDSSFGDHVYNISDIYSRVLGQLDCHCILSGNNKVEDFLNSRAAAGGLPPMLGYLTHNFYSVKTTKKRTNLVQSTFLL